MFATAIGGQGVSSITYAARKPLLENARYMYMGTFLYLELITS